MTGPTSRPRPFATATSPLLVYQADPIREGLRRLGRRWTLLLLRDMAFLNLGRFGEFLRNNPGLTPRVLSRRLREMQEERLIERAVEGQAVRYVLTQRGEDAVYILLAFLRYGLRHYSAASHAAVGLSPTSPLPGDRGRRAPVASVGGPSTVRTASQRRSAAGPVP